MRIAIDARTLSHPQPGGFKTYTTNLVNSLLALDSNNEYIIYLDRSYIDKGLVCYTMAKTIIVQQKDIGIGMPLREQFSLPAQLHRDAPDVVHFPCATGSILLTIPCVLTIHDAIELIEHPRLSYPLRKSLRRFLMNQYSARVQRMMASQAEMIITNSDYSKSDIIRLLGVQESKVIVVSIAQSDKFKLLPPNSEQLKVSKRLNLPEAFLLALVSASPRKNSLGLLRIYSKLPDDLKASYPLCMVFTHDYFQSEVSREVSNLNLNDFVHFLPRVSDSELVLLYNAATLFVYPSLYEGFGLPILEAMACGTPVVASNRTSIPEVAGDAAVLMDPLDESAFAHAIEKLLIDPERRAFLVDAGLRHSQQFSWERTAKLTLEVYQEAASHHNLRS